MIDKNSAQVSMDLARDAMRAGYSVIAQPNTPLAELCAATKLLPVPLVQSMESLEETVADLSVTSNNTNHNNGIDAFVKLIVDSTNLHLSFVKNVVVAAIDSTAKRVMAGVGAAPLNPVTQFTVVEKALQPPLAMLAFQEAIRAHITTGYLEPEKQIKLEPITGPDILELLKTGSGMFDEEVIRWWNIKGDFFFKELWDNLFVSATKTTPARLYSLSEIFTSQEDGVDAAIAVYLISTKILKDPASFSSNLDSGELERIALQHAQYAAKKISFFLDDIKTAATNAQVVMNVNTLKSTITVYGNAYRAWLKDGGKPEILFGVLISNSSDLTVAELNANSLKHLKVWENFKGITVTRFKNEQYAQFISELRTCFYQDLSTATELERSYDQEDPTHLSKIGSRLEKELLEVTTLDQTDIVRCVARIVCRARYYHTDAYKIITSIDEATRLNPEMPVEDAVTHASYEYVADYVAAQMRLV